MVLKSIFNNKFPFLISKHVCKISFKICLEIILCFYFNIITKIMWFSFVMKKKYKILWALKSCEKKLASVTKWTLKKLEQMRSFTLLSVWNIQYLQFGGKISTNERALDTSWRQIKKRERSGEVVAEGLRRSLFEEGGQMGCGKGGGEHSVLFFF